MKKLLALMLCAMLLLGGTALAEGGATDGAYTVTSPGFYGELNVTVVIEGGAISDIVVKDCPETPELGGRAIDIMTMEMIDNNTSGVDSVSGATVTSAYFRMAVNAALKQANAPEAMTAKVAAPEKTNEAMECDVLVMGSGTAGLSAAIAAAEAGASVLVIEKQDIPGGSAVTSAGIVYAPVDENDKAAMVQYYMDRAEGNANEALLTFYADNALDTIAWLEGLGVQWLMTVPAGTAPEPRARFSMTAEGVGMTGAALVNPMLEKLNALGVEVLCGVKGTELLVDADGAITGAKAESKAADYEITAKSVILATGGFDASKEMKAQYSPVAENDFPLSSKGNVGDGINMGMAIGAATEFKGGVIGFDFVDGSLPASGMNAVAMYCSSYVQPDGTFVSKVIDYPITYTAIKALGVDHFYGLYDAAGAETAEAAVAVGFGWKGDTVEALAEATGMDAAKLADAIAQDPDLKEAPYYAVMVKPTTIGSMGGLVIDTDARVLKDDGSAIPGLYATGEVANGGFYNVEYPASGSSLSLGMTFGLEAGRNAAEYVK
ncbi:MAG: FAD-dependent oxidoreductase [Clostridia bacterium]|nr:FAD-dependent oxidoreductase [Clostridia bacterium]